LIYISLHPYFVSSLLFLFFLEQQIGDAKMKSNFEGFEPDLSPANSNTGGLALEFVEMLSAYIDGELSPAEKNQVQNWLDQDPKIKQVYLQLLALQGQMHCSIAPASEKSVAEITEKVFLAVDKDRRWQRQWIWGSGAIAASLCATIFGFMPGFSPAALRTAELKPRVTINSAPVMLAVAINKPAINIPKPATDYSDHSFGTNETRD
jgi:anti-sigma factor RsiW